MKNIDKYDIKLSVKFTNQVNTVIYSNHFANSVRIRP